MLEYLGILEIATCCQGYAGCQLELAFLWLDVQKCWPMLRSSSVLLLAFRISRITSCVVSRNP